jgi:hypothetical protein
MFETKIIKYRKKNKLKEFFVTLVYLVTIDNILNYKITICNQEFYLGKYHSYFF